MFKKLLAILLACLMLIPGGIAMAEEAEALTSGDYEYIFNDGGSASITKYNGEAEALTAPAELDGHRVTAIGDKAFLSCDSLTAITLPDSVTSIRANPFESCDRLAQITVSPDHPTLATIDGVLFEKTTRTLICYPCALTAENYAVPQGIQAIGDWAFFYCDSLTTITLPDSVTSIGDYAFNGCDSLTTITLPDSVTTIGANPFTYCKQLTQITVSPDHPTLATIDGVLFEKATQTLICYPCAFTTETYAVPQGIQAIGDRAFNDCESLTAITLPDSLTSIGENAFADCPKLTLTVPRDSYALAYAKENGIPYTYPDSMDWLNG